MRVSHIHIQQTLLMLNNKKSCSELERQIQSRCNGIINQISVFNSTFDRYILPIFSHTIQFLIIRKCRMVESPPIEIFGIRLKTVELPHCDLKQFPIIHSEVLQKLNVSNNELSSVLSIRNKQLKVLDLRNNKILKITRQIYNANLTVLHEFISIKQDKSLLSLPICLYPLVIDIEQIIKATIAGWSNSSLVQTCELIIQNNNELLLKQLLPYLTQEFISKIFEISKLKRKHNIILSLLSSQPVLQLSDEQALQLLMPEFISDQYLYKVSLHTLIKILSTYNSEKRMVLHFFDHLGKVQKDTNFFIQSEKDLINFMSFNINFPNNYEADFLMTQFMFFNDYDFSNKPILQYLLQFDNLLLLRKLLELTNFREKMFALGFYKKLLKSNKKMYKLLSKQDKNYRKMMKCRNDLYFPEYKQRKSFCLKNDLYDYEILSEYEQMQCSYSHKDLKFTLKFCNKENEVSIAKRIETQLKRKNLKNMEIRRSHYSTSSSTYQS